MNTIYLTIEEDINTAIPSPMAGIFINEKDVIHVFIDGKEAYELTYEDFKNLADRTAVIHTRASK